MPSFQYSALDASGKQKKGNFEADTAKIVRTKLKEMGLIPIEIVEGKSSNSYSNGSQKDSFSLSSLFQPSMSNAALCLITRQISTLISSSMPIEETLRAVSQQCENPKHAAIISAVRDKVCEGLSLAEAMRKFPKVFDDLYTAMVAAGEKSGHLDDVLERLADYTESKQELRGKIIQAMIYPIMLTLVAVSVIGLLLSSVVPKVVEQFIHMKATLPTSTIVLIAISDFVKSYGFFIVMAVGLVITLFMVAMKRPNFKKIIHGYLLKMPVIGKVSRSLNTARYAQTLSILHSSAVPLIEGMHVSSDTLTNVVAKERLTVAAESVREGKGLSRSLQESALFTPMMLHMIASGEKSGELDNMLGRAANNQSNEFKRNISMALSIFEPLLIVSMAGIVLFIVISILQPLLQMNSMVGH
jgi:general secretion pathway protein F